MAFFVIALALVVLTYAVPWVLDRRGLRSYPGPWLAKVSDTWLAWIAVLGHRSEEVYILHQKLGPIVRLAPNHISISDLGAFHTIYAHGSNMMKSHFYDGFVTITPTLFTTQSRCHHARKRKFVSHIFSFKSVLEFQPVVREHLHTLISHWDRMCDLGRVKDSSGSEGEGGWVSRDGRVWFDSFPWFGYLAFDIIGDLAFGSPFGMTAAAKDAVLVPNNPGSYSKEQEYIPAIASLHARGAHTGAVGVLHPAWRTVINRLVPWFSKGFHASQSLKRVAIATVAKRLANGADRTDILSKLQEGKDAEGKPLGPAELTAEAQTMMLAGSDTTANTLGGVIYFLAGHRRVQDALRKELDGALAHDDNFVPLYEVIKNLPYLEAVINEAMRLHSTLGQGLERVVPKGGITLMSHFFTEGTIISTPTYNLHRDPKVWGEDSDTFRPERWFEGDAGAMNKSFYPFSMGPRACIGRNLAIMDMSIMVATLVRRYDFVLEDFSAASEIPVQEGFLRKPVACRVGMKARDVIA